MAPGGPILLKMSKQEHVTLMIDMSLMRKDFTMTKAMKEIEFWQGGDYNGDGNLDWMDDHCATPMYPHDGSSNPAGVDFDEEAGTLTLNGVGAYIGFPKAVNGLS